jgi:general stress protein 26
MIMGDGENHILRIKRELKAAGATWYGLKKAESRYLPRVLHNQEHVEALVYGQYSGGSGMLVATDLRVVFIDRKPGYTNVDEVTYDMVSGIAKIMSGPFTSITLHTRLGDYSFKYASAKAASRFVSYIEKRRLESLKIVTDLQPSAEPPMPTSKPVSDFGYTREALTFLKEHDLATLSTLDREGKIYGAVVHYIVPEDGLVYVVTKSQTRKALNVLGHSQVAFTVYDGGRMQTLQMQGEAKIETDQIKKDQAFDQIVRSRLTGPGNKQLAVAKIEEGSYIIISISPTIVHFRDFAKS